jgi:hypothetical protein
LRKATPALFITALLASIASAPTAQAAGGTITIVASGGSAEGTNWNYSSGTITSTASVSINATDVVSKLNIGPLRIDADAIAVNTNIIYTNSNSLTLVTTGNIILAHAITIQSQGGDLIFNSDSDTSNSGVIRLGNNNLAGGTISSNGGDIIFGGGSNPYSGRAMASSADIPAGKWASGFSSWGYTINAGGGDIQIRAGSLDLNPYGSRPLTLEVSSGTSGTTLSTTDSGNISLYSDAGTTTMGNPWSIYTNYLTVSTGEGSIYFNGIASTGGAGANKRGVIFAGTTSITSAGSGSISIIDGTNGSLSSVTGLNFLSTSTISTSGDILIKADVLGFTGATSLTCRSALIRSSTNATFSGTTSFSNLAATNCKSLTLGESGNASTISIPSALTVSGPITVNSGALTVGGTLTARDSLITLNSSGLITQTAAMNGFLTVSSASNRVEFRKSLVLTASFPPVPGKITFYANGKKISGCIARPTTGSSATCTWKPTQRGSAIITGQFNPTAGGVFVNSTRPINVGVSGRSSSR